MTLIAPSTLIAIQSQAAPATPVKAKPQTAFEPLKTENSALRRDREGNDVQVRLSKEALAFLGSASTDPASESATGVSAPKRAAVPTPDDRPLAPAGSTLDIRV